MSKTKVLNQCLYQITAMANYTIRPLNDDDREWVMQFIAWQWGVEIIVLRGVVLRAETLPGFVAICGDEIAGLITR